MASRELLLVLTLVLCAVAGVRSDCSNATKVSTQLDALLAEYDREVPPASQVSVLLSLDVKHATIDQGQSVMRLLADLKMVWRDARISWNTSEWGCDNALTSAERLWLPDIVLLNAAAHSAGEAALRARLDAAGSVTYVTRLDLTAPVALDLYTWPRDVQSCTFKFGSRIHSSDEMVLQITDFKHAVVFETGAWDIQSVSGETSSWSRGADSASCAAWSVRVARRAPAHALGAAAVLVATVLLLVAAAALPPQDRPPLAACASFTAALWLCTSLSRLPGAHSCPRALHVACALCALGAACAALAALVRRVARCSAPPPRVLRQCLSSVSNVCRLTPTPDTCGMSESGAWAAAAVLLDRVLCALLLFTAIVLLCVQLF